MKFTLIAMINASSAQIYETWLSSEGHTNMTGGKATASNKEGGHFSSWDGYIWGINISLEKYISIKQTWRTAQFEENEEDSIIEIILKEYNGATELTLIHSNVPESGGHYKKGWEEHYFQPMKQYFAQNT